MQQTSLRLPRGKAGTENAHCSTPRVSGWFVAYYYGNGQQTHGVLQMSSKMRALLLFSPSSQHPRPSRPWGHRSRQRILWKVMKTADQPTTRQVVVQAMAPQPEERTASDSGGSLCREASELPSALPSPVSMESWFVYARHTNDCRSGRLLVKHI